MSKYSGLNYSGVQKKSQKKKKPKGKKKPTGILASIKDRRKYEDRIGDEM